MQPNGSMAKTEAYQGLHPFRDQDQCQKLFFGRDNEKTDLLRTVLSEKLTLLFGRSGLGKTSLVQAGLIPELRSLGFFPIKIRLTFDKDSGPVQSIFLCIDTEIKQQQIQTRAAKSPNSLWEYFYSTSFSLNGKSLRPILLIDQFEELFTVYADDKKGKNDLLTQLSDLIRGRMPDEVRARETAKMESLPEGDPERKNIAGLLYESADLDVKIMITIREDFLPDLETITTYIPEIFRNLFRLMPLTPQGARDAIIKPAQCEHVLGTQGVFSYEEGVVEQIITFLRRKRIGGKWSEGDEIEPAHLQILCLSLDRNRRSKGRTNIQMTDFDALKGMRNIMSRYYQNILSEYPSYRLGSGPKKSSQKYIPKLLFYHRPRKRIQRLCETGLITPSGNRNSLAVEEIVHRFGILSDQLQKLVEDRLLRCEPRLGTTFYELSHDTLIEPISVLHKKQQRIQLARYGIIGLLILAIMAFSYLLQVSNKKLASAENEAGLMLKFANVFKGTEKQNYSLYALSQASQKSLYLKSREPDTFAKLESEIGDLYFEMRDIDNNADSAIVAYEQAYSILAKSENRAKRNLLQINLAILYKDRTAGTDSIKIDNLNKARTLLFEILTTVSRSDSIFRFAKRELGNLYEQYYYEFDNTAYLDSALMAYKDAMTLTSRFNQPIEYAMLQNNLGSIYKKYLSNDAEQHLRLGLATFWEARKVLTERLHEEFNKSSAWGKIHRNMGEVYQQLYRCSLKSVYLDSAITAYDHAKEYFSKTGVPEAYADIQMQIGDIYLEGTKENSGVKTLHHASFCFEEAYAIYQEKNKIEKAILCNYVLADIHRRLADEQPELADTYAQTALHEIKKAIHAISSDTAGALPKSMHHELLIKCYEEAVVILHEHLFNFTEAYETANAAYALAPDSTNVQMNMMEAAFTSSQIAACGQMIDELYEKEALLGTNNRIILHFFKICNLLFQLNPSADGIKSTIPKLLQEYQALPDAATLGWQFNGTDYFIAHTTHKDKAKLQQCIGILHQPKSQLLASELQITLQSLTE